MKAAVSRDEWITILDAAACQPGDQLDDEWRWLLARLGLSADDYPAIVAALQQGRWRNAKSPRAYLRTVARRETSRMERPSKEHFPLVLLNASSDGEFSFEGAMDELNYIHDTSHAVRGGDGVWRAGGGAEAYSEFDGEGKPLTLRSRLLAKLPNNLKRVVEYSDETKNIFEEINASTDEYHIHPTPVVRPDMEKWADLAGFDEWEKRVLEYKLNEFSRDKAMTEQPNDRSRRQLQAAWKRFDRTGKDRLREVAEKSFQKSVPEVRSKHTS